MVLLFKIHNWLAQADRTVKRLILSTFDFFALAFALWAAYALRLSDFWPQYYIEPAWWLFIVVPSLGILLFSLFGLYRAVLRFVEFQVFSEVLKGILILTIFLAMIALFVNDPIIPRSIPFIFTFIAITIVAGVRQIYRSYYQSIMRRVLKREKVAIYGAGGAGAQLAAALLGTQEYDVVAFFDDDVNLWKSQVLGIRVHSPQNAGKVIEKKGITRVLLAIPSASKASKRDAIARMADHPVKVLSMPSMPDIVTGIVRVDELERINVDDLLGREVVPADPALLGKTITDKSVLVTGGGGSIGSELCRKILSCNPQRLVILESSEANLYFIHQELKNRATQAQIVPILGSVTNAVKVDVILSTYDIETIYHAAAHKHVPIVEENICEGIETNILGTQTVAQAAARHGVERFILISTDKAVRPTNIMGASKRAAELIVQDLATRCSGTVFSSVRFGNVLGSSGSVVPLFKKQIAEGGPVTVTHREINRFFMTISEAAELVIQAGSLSKSGDVFVLDMGTPIRIADLARRMIHLSGNRVKCSDNPDGDIEIIYTGLRPGEKLYEELIIGDGATPTRHPRIMRAVEAQLDTDTLVRLMEDLDHAVQNHDGPGAKALLEKHIIGYKSSEAIVDLLAHRALTEKTVGRILPGSDQVH